jgi:hypothetical protein
MRSTALVRLEIVPAKLDPINQASSQVGLVLVSTVNDARTACSVKDGSEQLCFPGFRPVFDQNLEMGFTKGNGICSRRDFR